MARKGSFKRMFTWGILILAGIGAYVVWTAKPTQEGISAAKKLSSKAGNAVKAVKKAW